jgi:hypothetical protein
MDCRAGTPARRERDQSTAAAYQRRGNAGWPHGFYTENPISVELEGGYHQVGSFISQLANLDRIINIRNLKLKGTKPQDQARDDINHTVTATMQILTYSMENVARPAGSSDVGSNPNLTQASTVSTRPPAANTIAAAKSHAGGSH